MQKKANWNRLQIFCCQELMFDGFGILYAKQTQFRVSPGRDIEETVMPDAVTEASWAQ